MSTDLPLVHRSASDLAERIRAGEVRPTELVDAYLDRIDEHDGELNAYVTVTDELAAESAREAERALESDDSLGPLHGVPIALKDGAFLKAGVRHTFGSAIFAEREFEAQRTSVVTERLEAAGALLLGKTNLPEFAHKGTTDNQVVGATATPFDTTKNAGGSSGGSAAAVAAGMAAAATGSDAGGSIRIPAALCGVFGLKPSFGLVPWDSRPNAFGRKTHHTVLGPITRTVEDAALLMAVMAGSHPSDPSAVPVDLDYEGALDRPVADLRIGYSPGLDAFDPDEEVTDVVADALGAFEAAGATVEETAIGHGLERDELVETIETTFSMEAAGGRALIEDDLDVDLRTHPETSDSLLALLDIAEERDHADLALTGPLRTKLFDAVQKRFESFDLLVSPTVGRVGVDRHQEVEEYLNWMREYVYTWPFNFTGHPAASVPAGLTDDGLPVGMQVVGPRYEDATVLAASAAVERERPWQQALVQSAPDG